MSPQNHSLCESYIVFHNLSSIFSDITKTHQNFNHPNQHINKSGGKIVSDQTANIILIKRGHVGTIQDYCEIKNIKNKIIRMRTKQDHNILKPYEKLFRTNLGILDAIVISPLTASEIKTITKNYHTNKELQEYQATKSKKGLLESREEQDVNLFQ